MSIFSVHDGNVPEWGELDAVHIEKLKQGQSSQLDLGGLKGIVFCCEGKLEITHGHGSSIIEQDEHVNLEPQDLPVIIKGINRSLFVLTTGTWSGISGASGVFHLYEQPGAKNPGDSHKYKRNTVMDYHYHDCDEYWIITGGSGKILLDGKEYEVQSGDCVATPAGEHHDMHWVNKELHGVYLETSLTGKMRTGHLWSHTHGEPVKSK